MRAAFDALLASSSRCRPSVAVAHGVVSGGSELPTAELRTCVDGHGGTNLEHRCGWFRRAQPLEAPCWMGPKLSATASRTPLGAGVSVRSRACDPPARVTFEVPFDVQFKR
jgi:hypothetical protein